VGVFAAYASRFGHTLIDRRLYLPKGWAEDPERRDRAKVPEEVAFATKPAMAREMVARILDDGIPCAFVLADALYGSDYQFRRMLEERGQAYVLAIRSNHVLRFLEEWKFVQTDPATLIGDLEAQDWEPLSAGEGAKGARLNEWVRLPLNWQAANGFARWLLARRSLREPEAIAYYFAYAPAQTTLAELAGAAGLRWTIEECFLRAKDIWASITARPVPGMAGTAPYEPRHGRRRVPRQAQRPAAPQRLRKTERNESGHGGMIHRLERTCSTVEILHLIARLMPPCAPVGRLHSRLVAMAKAASTRRCHCTSENPQ